MKFEDYQFSQEVKDSIERLGFKKPTDIQFKAIPPIMKGEDVLAIAQTGTGKTAAFAIPVIDKLHRAKISKRSEGIKCLVMVPTRELAMQIAQVFTDLARFTKVKTLGIFGGVEQDPQINKLVKGIDILVATPGRMFDLVHQGYISYQSLRYLIIDEADQMLDLGFIKDIRDVQKFLPARRQTLFFSATIDKNIKDLAYSLVNNPIRIHISPKNPVSKNVNHSVVFIEMDDKRFFLERMIAENPESKMLIFVRTKVRAERVQKAMERVKIQTFTIHGDKEQKDRLKVMNGFKNGDFQILIATDVSARGIDIPEVDYVINYDLPDLSENYVHRVGRTGRGMRKGFAVSFCSTEEKEKLAEIEAYLGRPVERIVLSKEEYRDTIDFSEEAPKDWRTLIEEAELEMKKKRRKKK
jgi:ATP-dependent RNA helicase RhlE